MSSRFQTIGEDEFQSCLVQMLLDSAADAFAHNEIDDAIKNVRTVLARFPDSEIAKQLLTFYLSIQANREAEDHDPTTDPSPGPRGDNFMSITDVLKANRLGSRNREVGMSSTIVLGVIIDRKENKVLIGRRREDKDFPELKWAFPGGRLKIGEAVVDATRRKIREETALEVVNVEVRFVRIPPEKRDLIVIYASCDFAGGKQKPRGDFSETKWVKPTDIEKYFTTSIHPDLATLWISNTKH